MKVPMPSVPGACGLRRASQSPALTALLFLMMAVLLSAPAGASTQVPQGGTVSVAPTGHDEPAGTGISWDVVLSGAVVANSAKPGGWLATYGSAADKVTITAPLAAKTASNYEARIAYNGGSAYYSVTFNVVVGLKGFHLLPTSVVGGGATTGTVTLTSPAPAGGTTVTVTSSNKSVKASATVTVPKGASVGTFPVTSVPVSANLSASLGISCAGESLSAPLKVYAKPVLAFKKPVAYSVPGSAWLVAADVDGDGHPDVVVAGDNQIGVLYGKGDGTLVPYQSFYTWSGGINSAAVADLNGDGKQDVIATAGGGWVLIFMNQGKRQFAAPIALNIANAWGVAVGDFTGDAKPDLAVQCAPPGNNGNSVEIWLNQGSGKFVKASTISVMKNSATRLNSQITGTEPGKMTHWEPLQVVFEP